MALQRVRRRQQQILRGDEPHPAADLLDAVALPVHVQPWRGVLTPPSAELTGWGIVHRKGARKGRT